MTSKWCLSGFPTKILYAFLISPTPTTCSIHLIPLRFILPKIFCGTTNYEAHFAVFFTLPLLAFFFCYTFFLSDNGELYICHVMLNTHTVRTNRQSHSSNLSKTFSSIQLQRIQHVRFKGTYVTVRTGASWSGQLSVTTSLGYMPTVSYHSTPEACNLDRS
jgi:hypothetical protein